MVAAPSRWHLSLRSLMGIIALLSLCFYLAINISVAALLLMILLVTTLVLVTWGWKQWGWKTWRRKAPATLSFLLLIASIGLWAWTAVRYDQPLPGPSIATRRPGLGVRLCAWENGAHFLCSWERPGRAVTIEFDRKTPRRYTRGFIASFLGFTIAVLTHTYLDGDLIDYPHAALVLPYWFLIILFGRAFLLFSGISGLLSPYCRFSRYSYWSMTIVALAFAMLNCKPFAWRPGASITVDGLIGWATLVFNPASYPVICLEYGFPFVCYRRGIINGTTVQMFYGYDRLGWQQHKAIENFCIALAVVVIVGMTVEWMRRGRARRGSVT